MTMPQRILDLHTHLFNARYLPLSSIIANAMKREKSRLANGLARLLYAITDSSYEPREHARLAQFVDGAESDEIYVDAIWNITEFELLAATQSLDAIRHGAAAVADLGRDTPAIRRMVESELMAAIEELAAIDYVAEGWTQSDADALVGSRALLADGQLPSILSGAQATVKRALRIAAALMDRDAWGDVDNYIKFFFTILGSEERMVERLFKGYGEGLPPLQAVHYMMDMQLAYLHQAPPYYLFYPEQIRRMELVQRAHPARIFGFAAFDPRREDWEAHAMDALAKGFLGFKFYPAMGYKPSGGTGAEQARIDEFFSFCESRDVPIFVHCTPVGFQTLKKEGGNAHPKYWRDVLRRWPDLRLCLGHAGGGKAQNGPLQSWGWEAEEDSQWQHPDCFASIVVELCRQYPNVYCEFGHLTHLLHDDGGGVELLRMNIARAEAMTDNAGGEYAHRFLDKVAYGTDWHMHGIIDDTREYLDLFVALFADAALAPYREQFFWMNGYRYLKLHP